MATEFRKKDAPPPRILVVDDDAGQRSLLDSFLQSQGFATTLADSGGRALEILRTETFGMMISDVRMPGLSGLETLRRIREQKSTLPVLLVTAYADIREAVGAMRDGAVNYLPKPINLDELLASVQSATGLAPSAAPRYRADKALPESVVVRSPLMQNLFQDVSLIAPSETRVLITGESGAGKEVVADVLHAWSARPDGPLIKVNCAAIPETLLETELFGHEKGSFTGATKQRLGRFEEANGGTVFLDEIAEMSPRLQGKLLRVTQDGCFQRVGSNREVRTDARLLAASNRNLEEEVKAGRFREDLFYRLNVVELNVPPLRERREDILPLAGLFIGDSTAAWSKAAGLSAKVHVRYLDRPYRQVLAEMPRMYDDLWTGGKGMYKLEPVIADGGEVIIYAPHITEVSYTHGRILDEIGYHVRDYFVKQWDRFKDYPWGVLAHSTHVRGMGTYENGIERPRVQVTLATGIPPERCRRLNLGYRDPASIDVKSFAGREDEGILCVPHAGEILYRLKQ